MLTSLREVTQKYSRRFYTELFILPTSIFSVKPGTINFEWEIEESSDNFSLVPWESDEEPEHLPITISHSLTKVVELVRIIGQLHNDSPLD